MSSPRSTPASTCSSRTRTGAPSAGSSRPCGARRRSGCSTRTGSPARERALDALRRWIASFEEPSLDVVGSADHRALARELAARSLTLVRDDAGLLPLRLSAEHRILAVMPAPKELTPADTSPYVAPSLAESLRAHGPQVDEVVTSHPPTAAEIAGLRSAPRATTRSSPARSARRPAPHRPSSCDALLAVGRPVVTVALRTPWDLAAYPEAGTHLCTYSILPESMVALAAALFGRTEPGAVPFPGRLPVRLAGAGLAGVA